MIEARKEHGYIKDTEFYSFISDIVESDEFLATKKHRHHIKGSVYDHSIKAAYFCYRHHKLFGTKINIREFVRGALLHDYYLYDWHDKVQKYHGVSHPARALENALRKYPDLTPTQQDMILRHMFPLTLIPPRTRAGWLLCFYDKVAAICDYCGKNRWK